MLSGSLVAALPSSAVNEDENRDGRRGLSRQVKVACERSSVSHGEDDIWLNPNLRIRGFLHRVPSRSNAAVGKRFGRAERRTLSSMQSFA